MTTVADVLEGIMAGFTSQAIVPARTVKLWSHSRSVSSSMSIDVHRVAELVVMPASNTMLRLASAVKSSSDTDQERQQQ